MASGAGRYRVAIMARRRRWLRPALVSAVAALLLGRWLAVRTANRLWADSLGVTDAHAAIANLKLLLTGLAFAAAAAWCIGNLYLVYRSIGSVQVPRRLGNIEIAETVPRRYLLYGAVGIGLIIAFATSHGAGDWWTARALLDVGMVGSTQDPVLGRDVAYYLFQLPWVRTVHGFMLLLSGIMLVIALFLYVAVGAIRWSERRVSVTDLARTHVGVLLVTFALALFWGYRLEPAELVAGLHNVPYDTVMTGIRIPVARVLSGMALVVAGASAIWIWLGHVTLIGVAWAILAVGSFVGHYVAPAFAAAGRAPEERADPVLDRATGRFVRDAFALSGDTMMAQLAIPDPEFTTRHRNELLLLPVWDPSAVTMLLNRMAQPRAFDRFFDATLGLYGGDDPTPLFLAVREVDLATAEENERGMTWKRRHGLPYARAAGAIAVHATRVSEDGLPLFVPDLSRPESTAVEPTDLALEHPDVWFGPATSHFAVAEEEDGPFVGVKAGGLFRRLALAWTLQSPALLNSGKVAADAYVLADRAVGSRLARLAPFARFGGAYPVIVDGAVLWLAAGYVWAEAYPLSTRTRWRGRDVRYLRAGMLGVVEAHSGASAVYLLPDADLLSRAWALLAPDVVRPTEEMPEGVRSVMRYPDELFRVQLGLLLRSDWRGGQAGAVARRPEPYWWSGPGFADSLIRLRLRAVIEVQFEALVSTIIDGVVIDGRPRLDVIAYPGPLTLTGPSELVHDFAADVSQAAAIPGQLKVAAFPDGAIGIQAFYAEPGPAGPLRLAEVVAGWRGAIGRGRTLPAALRQIRVEEPIPARPPIGGEAWEAARRWFERLDSARAAGDWAAFGEAYDALKRLLGQLPESGR